MKSDQPPKVRFFEETTLKGRKYTLCQFKCGCSKLVRNDYRYKIKQCNRHPPTKHGYFGTRIYRIWAGMLNRCNSESSGDWKNYGGRGIKVCDRWLKFENFLEDNLDSYKDYLSIDRIDVNGNYEPSNCRWANFSTQNRNRRTVKLTVKDIPKIFYFRKSGLYQKEIAEIFGVHRKTIGDVLGGKTWT